MNNTELINHVATTLELKKKDVRAVLKTVADSISTALIRGGSVRVSGVGIFAAARQPARVIRNPRTGDLMRIRAVKKPKFSATKQLKNEINGR